MRKIFFILVVVMLYACQLMAGETRVYTPDNLPKVRMADKMRYVCDPEGILSVDARNEIDRMLYDLEQRTGIETVVAVVPSIGNEDVFNFSHQLLNQWGVGKKEANNGLVISLVLDQRRIQIYTGYGLEGDLPDAICKRIQSRYMVPFFKSGHWDEGMVAGVQAICKRLSNSGSINPAEQVADNFSLVVIILFLIVFVVYIYRYYSHRKATKCPRCQQYLLERRGVIGSYFQDGIKVNEVNYKCRNCGYSVVRKEREDEHFRGGGPIIFGPIGGFGGGGGWDSGGDFGGGSGGGGGAGSDF